MRRSRNLAGAALAAAMMVTMASHGAATADVLPGSGKTVGGAYLGDLEGLMQTKVIEIGLQRLGYEVDKTQLVNPTISYLAVAQGDVAFHAEGWMPTHETFFASANKNDTLELLGPLISGATSGYFIDKKTAEEHGIHSVEQLKDPEIAKLFDADGKGKASLYGCPPGWGCERRIEHHLEAYGLNPTVDHVQGDIAILSAQIIQRYRDGDPVLFFTYSPQWLSQVLVPGKDVEYLEVPFTSMPDGGEAETTLPDGRNIGHQIANVFIVANADFLAKNPAAKRLFELVSIPVAEINHQNFLIHEGEKSSEDIQRHAEDWIARNEAQFDQWIEEARLAGQ